MAGGGRKSMLAAKSPMVKPRSSSIYSGRYAETTLQPPLNPHRLHTSVGQWVDREWRGATLPRVRSEATLVLSEVVGRSLCPAATCRLSTTILAQGFRDAFSAVVR